MPSTVPQEVAEAHVRRARAGRRAGVVLLTAFVALGATGLLGTRTTTSRAAAGGYELTVVHPAVSRSGHAVQVEVHVQRAGGFAPDEPVRLRFLSSYFDLFDENAFSPEPDAEEQDATYTYDEFLPPPGDTLVVDVDTRVEPARNVGEAGEVAVVGPDDAPVVVVPFRTRLLP